MLAYNESWRWSSSFFLCLCCCWISSTRSENGHKKKSRTIRLQPQLVQWTLEPRLFWLQRPKWCISSPQPFLDCALNTEKKTEFKKLEICITKSKKRMKKFNRVVFFFGLFLQHGIYLIHAFVLCKFKPLPRLSLHKTIFACMFYKKLSGIRRALLNTFLSCQCGTKKRSFSLFLLATVWYAKSQAPKTKTFIQIQDKVFNLKANKTANTIKVKQIKLQ